MGGKTVLGLAGSDENRFALLASICNPLNTKRFSSDFGVGCEGGAVGMISASLFV
jgi:hypothetical protein